MIVSNQDAAFHECPAKIETGFHPILRVLMVLALAILLPVSPLLASERAPLILTGPIDVKTFTQHLEYIIDDDWQLKPADFNLPSAVKMKPVLSPAPDFGYTAAKVWLRVRLVNGTASVKDWRLLSHTAVMQKFAAYKLDPQGQIHTLVDYNEDTPFADRVTNHPLILAPFELAPGETTSLVISYFTLGASRHSFLIETSDSLLEASRTSTAINFAFYGMMLVMITLAVVALVTLRQFVFAAYACYFLSIFIYIMFIDGTGFQLIWPDTPRFNSIAAAVTGPGIIYFGAMFAMSFLQTARFNPIMHRILLTLVLSIFSLEVILWKINFQLLNRILVYLILVSVITFLIAGLVAARKRFHEVRFYVIAWAFNCIPAFHFTLAIGFGINPTGISPFDVVRMSLVLDALLMGLAIFDRYNQMRQAAVEETLAHAQRALALTQRLAALEVSYDHATASARQREASVKDTVHDLRQPMHALRLSLRQFTGPDGGKRTDFGQIESALAYMEQLVDEQLAERPVDTTAIAVRGSGDKEEPGLHTVLRGIADMFESEASDKGLELKLVLAAPDAKAAAYPLMRIVANLVSNAIKYTPQGRVLIGLRRHGGGHLIEVHDSGPGLSGIAFQQALMRSERLERDVASAEGSGLGLAVVKETANANGWRISACAGRKTGATVRLHLPA